MQTKIGRVKCVPSSSETSNCKNTGWSKDAHTEFWSGCHEMADVVGHQKVAWRIDCRLQNMLVVRIVEQWSVGIADENGMNIPQEVIQKRDGVLTI